MALGLKMGSLNIVEAGVSFKEIHMVDNLLCVYDVLWDVKIINITGLTLCPLMAGLILTSHVYLQGLAQCLVEGST